MNRVVALVVWFFAITAFTQAPAALFEAPAPTGTLPVGTTRWVITDQSRDETFAPGKKRDIEVIAWYPRSAGTTGTMAPYLRDGMDEAASFGRLAKVGDAWAGLAAVKTHAVIDAPPASTPARFPVILFQHGYTGLPSS